MSRINYPVCACGFIMKEAADAQKHMAEHPDWKVVGSAIPIRVLIIESERGWGQKIDEEKEFDTLEAAETFIKDYNKGNNLPEVPDWYMYARLEHERSAYTKA